MARLKIQLAAITIFLVLAQAAYAQGILSGTVTDAESGTPIGGIVVKLDKKGFYGISDRAGRFMIKKVTAGSYSARVESSNWESYSSEDISIRDGAESKISIALKPRVKMLGDVVVYGASKRMEKITESPAAVVAQFPSEIEIASRKGQLAKSLEGATGVDIMQNGASDFIVNTRGFNNGLNRRLLVLQDGRDAAMPLLGAQEWNTFSLPLDEFARVELVRGPSASLYGANAFNGVLNLTSYAPREVLGTKVSFLGGDYETYRTDVRHAQMQGDFSFKVTAGLSHTLNYSHRRDSAQFLEYAGLPLEKKVLESDWRNTRSFYGTFRADYDFAADKRLVAEFGYSRAFNEAFVFGLGRTFVKDAERPYVRLGYNSPSFNVHMHYMQRSVPDTMWLLVPGAPLLDNSRDMMADVQHNFYALDNLHIIWGVAEQFQQIRTSKTSIPDDVDANYTGIYSQADWKLSGLVRLVISARADFASIHSTQFSPRAALVISPAADHQFRLSFGRSFQRPNYSELYRVTPDAPAFSKAGGPPVNFTAVQNSIADSIAALTGKRPNINLGISATRAYAIGNDKLDVEKNLGAEFGYKGILGNRVYVTVDAYYNRLSDFITNFLPGINPDIQHWEASLGDSLQQFNALATDMVMKALQPKDRARLSIYNGAPAFVVSNANVGKVDQWGIELGINYYITDKLMINGNYSYYNYKVTDNNTSQPLLPNISPSKFNAGMSYIVPKHWDASVSFNYTEGFDWLAGTYEGKVPSFAVVNCSAGYYITERLNLGLNVNNLLDRKYYQVFGGTYLPRFTTLKATLNI